MYNIVASFFLVLLAAHNAHAGGNSLYVSTLGNDAANDCQTSASPCKTLGHAASLAGHLDSIFMAGGTYKESVTYGESGSLAIRGSYDESFVASNPDNPTILQSKKTRPLTFLYDGQTGIVNLQDITVSKSSSKLTADELSGYAGGVLIRANNGSNVAVSLARVTMHANSAQGGGALAVVAEDGSSMNLQISNSSFTKNKAFGCGAILVDSIDAPPAFIQIERTTFEKNKALDTGGAVCTSVTDASLTNHLQAFDEVAFVKNKASIGAGLFAFVIEGGHLDLELTNSVFLKNKAFVAAGIGAVALPSPILEADIDMRSINNTIAGNKGKFGGGGIAIEAASSIDESSTAASVVVDSTNDIVFGNKGGDALITGDAGTTSRLDREYSIYGSSIAEGSGQVVDGAGVLSVDPLFVKAGKDIHLQSISPAIDAGTCTDAPATDFEGGTRPAGLGCDIGADEF